MAFIPAADTMRVVFQYVINSTPYSNVIHMKHAVGPNTVPSMNAAGAALETWWTTFMQPSMSNESTLSTITMTDISQPNSFQVIRSVSLPGALVGATLPMNVAFVIKLSGAFIGRTNRGRQYIAPLREVDVVGNDLDTLRAGEFVFAYERFFVANAVPDYDLAIVSYQQNNVPRIAAQVRLVTDVSAVTLQVGTRRKRLP